MKTPDFGLLFFTRRAPYGKPARLVCEPCVLVRDLAALSFVTVLTSRPIHGGAKRRQQVERGQFLNLSRLGSGSPAAPQSVAKPPRDALSA